MGWGEFGGGVVVVVEVTVVCVRKVRGNQENTTKTKSKEGFPGG